MSWLERFFSIERPDRSLMSLVTRIVLAVLLSVCSSSAIAQQSMLPARLHDAPFTDKTATMPPVSPATSHSGLSSTIDRWVDVNELGFSSRYRSEKASNGFAFFANGQQRSLVGGRVKLDAAARYTVNFRVSSGRTFNWAYANVINPDFASRSTSQAAIAALPTPVLRKLFALLAAGYTLPVTPSRGWEMAPRQLYLGATPFPWLAAEYGSLAIERGQSSEITTYDDDGYLTGERLRLRAPKRLYFDEIAVTYAYEGDILKPRSSAQRDSETSHSSTCRSSARCSRR